MNQLPNTEAEWRNQLYQLRQACYNRSGAALRARNMQRFSDDPCNFPNATTFFLRRVDCQRHLLDYYLCIYKGSYATNQTDENRWVPRLLPPVLNEPAVPDRALEDLGSNLDHGDHLLNWDHLYTETPPTHDLLPPEPLYSKIEHGLLCDFPPSERYYDLALAYYLYKEAQDHVWYLFEFRELSHPSGHCPVEGVLASLEGLQEFVKWFKAELSPENWGRSFVPDLLEIRATPPPTQSATQSTTQAATQSATQAATQSATEAATQDATQ